VRQGQDIPQRGDGFGDCRLPFSATSAVDWLRSKRLKVQ
jgi:hypothetical protein